jgi:hypothetical protein
MYSCTPLTIPLVCRATKGLGVRHTTTGFGRNLAMKRVVRPDSLSTTITAALMSMDVLTAQLANDSPDDIPPYRSIQD